MKKVSVLYIPLFLSLIYFIYFSKIESLALSLFLLTVGCFVLIKGSDFFIEGAVGIAARLGMSEHSIGITVVAFGTSLPELAISGLASYQGHTETAWGNVIGSNVTNIFLVLGLAMIIIIKPSKFALKDSISMLIISFITIFLALDGTLQFYDGIFLISFYIIFLYMLKRRKMEEERKTTLSFSLITFLFILGVFGVAVGAEAMVRGAVSIAEFLGVREAVIAASIVAFGTSLPELATSITAAFKKHPGIAVGNVIGSNVVNLSLVLGLAAVLRSISISLLSPAIAFFIFATIITPLVLKKQWIGKKMGIAFICFYAIFIIFLYLI